MKNTLYNFLCFTFLLFPYLVNAQTASQVSITGAGTVATVPNNVATLVDPNIVVGGNGNITGFTVTITGSYTTGDVLSYNGSLPAGISTAGFNAATRGIQFSGTASPTVWQELLRRVTIRTTSATCFPEQRKVSFNFGLVYYNILNEHFYRLFSTGASWLTARANAESSSYYGYQGYLTTITSAAENSFIQAFTDANSWIGCSDNFNTINTAVGYTLFNNQSAADGKWYWVTGPERGLQMRNGNATGNNVGSAISSVYQNWANNEPNDHSSAGVAGEEDYGHMYNGNGLWNDFPNGASISYLVEYGGMPNDLSTSTMVYTRNINVNGAPTAGITGGNTTVCSGGNITLTVSPFAGSVVRWEWSTDDFLTAGNVINNTTTTLNVTGLTQSRYYRAILNTTSPSCSGLSTSSTFVEVAAAIGGNIVAQSNNICAGGSANLTLFGNEGGVVDWQVSTASNFSTLTTINSTNINISHTIASAGTYYFRARVQNGSCGSPVFSNVYTITVTSGTPPNGGTVNSVTHCGGTNSGTLDLTGSTGTVQKWQFSDDFGVVWTDIANTTTSQAYSGVTATRYYRAVLQNGSCGIANSVPGIVTVYNFTASNSGPVCSGTALNLGVTTTGGNGPFTYAWTGPNSFASTLQNPSVNNVQSNGAGTYSVAVSAPGCTATVTTSATVNATPTITSVTNNSRCGNGTVALGAAASAGTISWFADQTTSTALTTGTSYTTPSLSATTIYYVSATSGTCTSSPRTAVTATVNAVPTITASTGGARCGTGTVNISATASVGTIEWFAASTGGTSIGSGSPFATPPISSTTVFHAQANNNGCLSTARTAVTATVNSAPTLSTTRTDVSCFGGSNGSATVNPSGAAGPYTYAWSPGTGSTQTITGQMSGTYTVTVTAANTCSAQTSVVISQPAQALSTTGTQTNVSCNGGNNGAAAVTPSGGVGPYSYSWAPSGGTASSITGRMAGSYTVTVTDANGCTATRTFTITQPSAITLTTGAQTNVSCNGGSNGSATVNASGGTSPYTYFWAPTGGTAATASGLAAGTYTVSVTDANGCTATRSFTITQPTAISLTTGAQTNVVCNGGSNGTATVSPTGGISPYTYSWAPSGGTLATATGLSAGAYTVTVTDLNGCTATRSFTITQPTAISLATGTQTNVSCNGGINGAASVTPSGGVGPYTYSWAPSGNITSSITGRAAGTYTVTVTDANGCTATRSFNITEPSAMSLTVGSQTNVSCNGGINGAASVTPSGGVGPYTYSWAPSGNITSSITGRVAGTYTVTVTDANGCTATRSFNITEPSAMSLTVGSQTNVSCNGGSNGAASVTPSGGAGPYSYSWAPSGSTTSSITGRAAGTYTVTVTDANGCTATRSFIITQPSALALSTGAQTNVSCNGGSNGSATVNVSGGTGLYTYAWSPAGGTAATASGLTAGTYTVTVTDANGCTATRSFTITQPTAISLATGTQANVSCNGGSNGAASVTPSGGVGPYSYSWSPSGGTASSITGRVAGTYTVTVTDANGCTATRSFIITEPSALALTAEAQTNVSCNGGSNGSATVNVSGGTGPYAYAWSPVGGTSATASGLTAGSYTVTVTDANGCTATRSFTITQPSALVLTPGAQTNVSCNGGSNGSALVNAGGGTGSYTYLWSPSGGTDALASNLSAGSYSVTVTDENGCTANRNFTITQPDAISLNAGAQTNVSCNGGSNGSATVDVTGGTGPYTYTWSSLGGDASTASGLTAGTYTVTVTDAQACEAAMDFTITEPLSLTADANVSSMVSCFGGNNGAAYVDVAGGVAPYSYVWSPTGGNNSEANSLPAGVYTVIVTDANDCSASDEVVIDEPSAAIVITPEMTAVSCFGGNDGAISIAVEGGNPEYTLLWSNGEENAYSISGLQAGDYALTLTDASGCQINEIFTVSEPQDVLSAMISSTNVLCYGGNDGSVSIEVMGGTAPYVSNWYNGIGNETNTSGLIAGDYSVVVSDANGCEFFETITISEPALLEATVTSIPASCFARNDGQAFANVSGGTAPYAFNWTPFGGTSEQANDLSAGNYQVLIEDANGCTIARDIEVTEPEMIAVNLNETACDSYEFNGDTHTESGVYTYVFAAENGCDSTVTLTLNIRQSTFESMSMTACDSFELNGEVYTESGEYTQLLQNDAGCDSTLFLNLNIERSTEENLVITACDSYTLNGEIYTESGAYTQVLQNAAGCDSTLFLDLTINRTTFENITITVCDSFELNGEIYLESGEYTQVLQNTMGCDSILTLNLTIHPSSFETIVIEACGGYELNGALYTESGIYTQVVQNEYGCDHTIALELTVLEITSEEIFVTACDSYELNGEIYTASGEYTQVVQNEFGCNHTITLHLSILESTFESLIVIACDSYELNGELFTESGEYTQVLQNSMGCDSILTLNLTIHPSSFENLVIEACGGYELNGELYTESGIYTQVLQNEYGCDHTIALELTVLESTSEEIFVTACDSYELNGEFYTASGEYTQVVQNEFGCNHTITLHLSILENTFENLIVIACDSYELNGELYTESGEYTQMLQNAAGCDSTLTLLLTIHPSTSESLNATACDSYELNGEIYTESGVYTQMLLNPYGCDHIVTLNLTISQSSNETISMTACDSYTLNGETYTESGVYTQYIQNELGCDHIITLDLTIQPSSTASFAVVACDSYQWNGEIYTESGSYVQVLENANGCDSTITLNLTINRSAEESLFIEACNSYTLNNEVYTASGIYTQIVQTAAGCDSLITLNLTISPFLSTNVSVSACGSYVWNNQSYDVSGVYTQTLTAAAGCDSLVTLNLTILSASMSTVSAIAFQQYAANGITYYESGLYTQVLTNSAGCDSLVTYNVLITQVAGDTNGDGTIDGDEVAGDTNGDGTIGDDEVAGDTNGDGVITDPEVAGDTNGNGTIDGDEVAGDSNGDGEITDPEVAGDTNGDGTIDGDEVAGDTNGDGVITDPEVAGDTNGDGTIDGDEVAGDTNGDGVITDPEVAGDTNGDGTIGDDEVAGDSNGDGEITDPEVAGDTDGDGTIGDDEVAGDTNGDGEITDPEIAGDTNGDGTIDGDEVAGDTNGDGVITDPEVAGDTNGDGTIGDDEADGDANGDGLINCDDYALLGTLNESMQVVSCGPYMFNNLVFGESGVYLVEFVNGQGCLAMMTLDLEIVEINTSVEHVQGMLTAMQADGVTYQWIDCANNSPIAGATGQSFIPTQNGSYAVQISTDECSVTTECVEFNDISIAQVESAVLMIYPNPSMGAFMVRLGSLTNVAYELLDARGRVVETGRWTNIENKIDLSGESSGVYMLRVDGQNYRLVKQ